MIPVVWCNLNPYANARGAWDQQIVEDLTAGHGWDRWILDYTETPRILLPHAEPLERGGRPDGAVVVIPGQHNVGDRAEWLAEYVAELDWALVIVTSDEEGLFPAEILPHGPNHAVWGQYRYDQDYGRVIPCGSPPDTAQLLAQRQGAVHPIGHRPLDLAYAGQVTHPARTDLVNNLNQLRDDREVYVNPTDGFAQGLDRINYLTILTLTRLAPCPPGPNSPDTFRLYETIQAGALPIIQNHPLWDQMFGNHPIPTLNKWDELAELADLYTDPTRWKHARDAVDAWWAWYWHKLGEEFRTTVEALQRA